MGWKGLRIMRVIIQVNYRTSLLCYGCFGYTHTLCPEECVQNVLFDSLEGMCISASGEFFGILEKKELNPD